MARTGWTKLYRKFWENEALKPPPGAPFSKREAWLDICNRLAAGVDNGELLRGEFRGSTRALAKRWNWHRNTVRRFLEALEKQRMITPKKCAHQRAHQRAQTGALFIVSNYSLYNGPVPTSVPTSVPTNRPTLKEGKESKEGKEEEKNARAKSLFIAWNEGPGAAGAVVHRKAAKFLGHLRAAQLTWKPEEIQLAFDRLSECYRREDLWAHRWALDNFLTRNGGRNVDKLLHPNWEEVHRVYEKTEELTKEQIHERTLKALEGEDL